MSDLADRLQTALGDAYRVERELARGGMSRLFLATEASLNRLVVVKLLPPEMASEVSAARFKQEIEVVARLQHPHVLPVHAAGSKDDLIYYVMPYVEGESLRHRLNQEGKLPVEEARSILTEVADALAFAHQRGIVHRDIKPENVLLQQGHAVLTDFGVARAVQEARGTRLTEAGVAVGTPGYMSPEQASGETQLDARSDVYALAVVGYEMLAGEPPFTGTSAQAVLAAHLTEAPKPLSEKRSETPPQLSAAIARALAKEPSERFQSAAEFRDALKVSSTVPLSRRNPGRSAMSAAAVALAAIIAVLLLWPRGWSIEGDPRKSLIVFPFENITGSAEHDYLQEASMNLLGLAVAHWEDMRLYDDERTSSLLRRRGIENPGDIDFDAAQAMARAANVGTLVLGDIRREGDSLAFEAKVHDVKTGERLATEIVRAPLDADPRPLFDSLASRILSVSGAPPGERPEVLSQTTRSLEAYRAYLRGVEALQQFQTDSAQFHLERAIEIDSTFALAYLRLRDVLGWMGIENDPETRRALIAQAQANSADLPPRLRTLLQFHSAYENGEYRLARGIAEQLIARDSSDTEAWYQLGEAHFHGGALRFPHDDTLGNVGTALNAFKRSLAIDPRYLLAYQHIVDALGSCGLDNPWICFADSAVYAIQQELFDKYSADRVRALRQQALDERLALAHEWVEAAPRSARARSNILGFLIDAERLGEARVHIEALRSSGSVPTARIWESNLLLREANYAGAADTMLGALEQLETTLVEFLGREGPDVAFAALSGGARIDAMNRFINELVEAVRRITGGTTIGPGDLELPIDVVAELARFQLAGELAYDPVLAARRASWWLDTVGVLYADDPATMERAVANTGSNVLAAYIASRDTSLLARFISLIDTTASRSWRTMDAHLALARGDTARAVMRVAAHVEQADDLEFRGDPGAVRAFAWADLLAKLGRVEDAIRVYGQLDSADAHFARPGLHVRSWAERGSLYQELGDRERAIRMYERFIEAWEKGDDVVHALVERARSTVAALRGQSAGRERGGM